MTYETFALVSSALHWGIGVLLAVAAAAFFLQFVVPGWRTGSGLRLAAKKLSALKQSGPLLDLDRVKSEAMVNEPLRHCWGEYRDTLHGQKQPNAQGVLEVNRWRATAMANSFFAAPVLVEAPLRTEFYKHLPGILTGLGIIGTFAGLILGLQGFKVSDDASVVRGSLETLIVSVGGAFEVSGIAIALAMLVTTVEKFIVNRRYTELEALCGVIDSLFDSGAGEEYLQRLVEASETSATQAMQMKESLVTDLKQVLSELTQQQIATMTSTSAQLGHAITTSLAEGLTEPLDRISQAVATVGKGQGDAVNKLLTDVLGSFASQMEGMFGSQMRGMNEMLLQTANTIQTTSQRFEALAGQIQQAGSGAADAMAKRMDEALQQMQLRQTEANDQMRLFIDHLKDSVAKGQSESAESTMNMVRELSESTGKLVRGLQEQAHGAQQQHVAQQNETTARMQAMLEHMQETVSRGQSASVNATGRLVGELGAAATGLVKNLQEQAHGAQQKHVAHQNETLTRMQAMLEQMQESMAKGQSASVDATGRLIGELGAAATGLVKTLQEQTQGTQQEHARRQAEIAARTTELLSAQSQQTAKLTEAVQQAILAMREAVQQLQATTHTNVERMGVGAERLLGASNRLGENLDTMKMASDGLGSMVDKLSGSTGTLSSALLATQQTLNDQKAVRDALAAMVADLRDTVENAKREAGLTSELVNTLQVASQRLSEAQRAADTYLASVTEVLGEAHGSFAKQMETTLREGNRAFHQELAQATGLLKGAIQELGDVLEKLPTTA